MSAPRFSCSYGSRHIVSVFMLTASFAVPASADESADEMVVIRGFEGTRDYALAAAEGPEQARTLLYRQYVTDPYMKACSGDGEQFSMSRKFLDTPIEDTGELLVATTGIEDNDVESRVRHWIGVAREHLPIKSLTVCIFPYSPDEPSVERIKKNLQGNMGFVERGGVLWTQFIPTDGWLDTLPHMVLHEYHHAVTYLLQPSLASNPTLLELLVVEGGAEAFALSVRADGLDGLASPLGSLSHAQQARIWSEMQEFLDSTEPEILQLYVFGDGIRIPRAAGYIIGSEIVLSFLANNPDVPAAQWSRMSAGEIVDKSGYKPDE
jgi:uncharacterized protein YjaZ